MKVWRISQFYGGNAIDERLGLPQQFADTSLGIDLYYKPSILRGNLMLETFETGGTDTRMQDFFLGSDGKTYGLGYIAYQGANLYGQLWVLSASTWGAAGTCTSSSPVEDSQIIEYKDYIYGYSQTNKLFRYGLLSGTPSFTESWQTTTNSLTRNGPMCIQNNKLYIGNGNLLASWDGTTFTVNALTLPSQQKIISLCPWGKYVVLAVSFPHTDTSAGTQSKLLFWDGSAELPEFSKDCPPGRLVGIRNMGDEIIGVVMNVASDTDHTGFLNIIKWSGGAVNVVWRHRLPGTAYAATLFRNNGLDVKSGIFYIGGILITSATDNYLNGVFTYGQPVPGGSHAFNHAIRVPGTTLQQLHCSKWLGTNLYVSVYDNTGTDYKIVRTTGTADNFEDFQYDSLIFDGGNPYQEKEIKKIIISTKTLPTNAVITLKYKVNRASSWTTIGTMTSGNQATFPDISGVAFNNFRELQLQLSSNMSSGAGLIEVTDITTLYSDLEIPA